jgi:hypothetical protein
MPGANFRMRFGGAMGLLPAAIFEAPEGDPYGEADGQRHQNRARRAIEQAFPFNQTGERGGSWARGVHDWRSSISSKIRTIPRMSKTGRINEKISDVNTRMIRPTGRMVSATPTKNAQTTERTGSARTCVAVLSSRESIGVAPGF